MFKLLFIFAKVKSQEISCNNIIINLLKKIEMENLVEQIENVFSAFLGDANAQIVKGNKAAGTRARKASLEMEKMLKEFRKQSLDAAKQ